MSNLQVVPGYPRGRPGRNSTWNCSISPLKMFYPAICKSTHRKPHKKLRTIVFKKVLNSEKFWKKKWNHFEYSLIAKSSHGMTSLFAHVVIVTHFNFNWVKNGDHPPDEWFQWSTAPIRNEFQPFKTWKIIKSGKYFRITGHPSSKILARDWLSKYRMLIGRENWLKREDTHFTHLQTHSTNRENNLENRILYRT